MQTDPDAIGKGGVDDDKKITFRPSPNFCNMKRFLKKKIVDTCSIDETASAQPVSIKSDSTPNATYIPQAYPSQIENKDVKPKIQPPLPLYPPPPDTPPPDLVTVKQEAEDYNIEPEDESSINVSQFTTNQPPTTPQQPVAKPKKQICKDYIRGNCLRTQCRFAHERDLSQLEGIYTFCWNYQNSMCMIPNCKYVHASHFEEGEFYRTGVLPAHAMNHAKQQSKQAQTLVPPPATAPPPPPPPAPVPVPISNLSMLPPPPPPPPEDPLPMDINMFKKPPPPLYTPLPTHDKPPMMMMMPPPAPVVSEMETRALEAFRMQQMMQPSTSKRDWRGMGEESNPLMTEFGEQASGCSSCADMEFRLQYNKSKVEKQMRINKELEDKSAQLDNKISKLYNVLVTILKPSQQAKTSTVPVPTLSTNET